MVGKELKSGAILLSSLAVSRWSEAAVIIGEIKRGLFFFFKMGEDKHICVPGGHI